MAIIDVLDTSVTIKVDDLELQEYDDEGFDDCNENTENPNDDLFIPSDRPVKKLPGKKTKKKAQKKGKKKQVDESVEDEGDSNEEDESPKRPRLIAISKYIQAETDKEYSVKFEFGTDYPYGGKKEKNAVRVEVAPDGLVREGRVVNWKYKKLPYSDEVFGKRQWNAGVETLLYRFRFAQLNIADDAPLNGNEEDIGTIRVNMWRITSEKGGRRGKDAVPQSADEETVNEKALKKAGATSHGTGYTSPEPTNKKFSLKISYIDGRENPFASFFFKFRSKKGLQALGIIPRSPSPTPFEMRDPATMTMEEKIEALKKFQLDAKIRAGIKRERKHPVINVADVPRTKIPRRIGEAVTDLSEDTEVTDSEDEIECLGTTNPATQRTQARSRNNIIVLGDDLDDSSAQSGAHGAVAGQDSSLFVAADGRDNADTSSPSTASSASALVNGVSDLGL